MENFFVQKLNNVVEALAPLSIFALFALCLSFPSLSKAIASFYLALFLVTWMLIDYLNHKYKG